MITAALWAAILAAPLPQDPPRLRTILANGAAILAERVPNSTSVGIVLTLRRDHAMETEATHGYVHLLEHRMLAREGLDAESESQGIFFTGRTTRDHLIFEIRARTDRWQEALRTLVPILRPVELTPEVIRQEADLMREELALREDVLRLSDVAWVQAFEAHGWDPMGNPDRIATAEPATLRDLQGRLVDGSQLNLAIVGSMDVDEAMARARELLIDFPTSRPNFEPRPVAQPGRRETDLGFGEVRAARMPSLADPDALGVLAAALVYASRTPDSSVIYSPTGLESLVVIGRTTSNSGLGRAIDEFDPAEEASYLAIARLQLEGYLRLQKRSPLARANWRSALLAVDRSLRAEDLEERAKTLSLERFRRGMAAFRKERAVIVAGVAR